MTVVQQVRIWVRIVGPFLPRRLEKIGGFTVVPRRQARPPEVLEAKIDLSGHHAAFSSSFLPTLEGGNYAYLDTVASDPNGALLRAIERDLPVLATSLSLGVENPYRVVPIGVSTRDGKSLTPVTGMLIFWEDEPLPEDFLDGVRTTHRSILKDETARAAANSLYHGFALLDLVPYVEVRSAALLNFFKVIETISVRVSVAPAEGADAARRDVVKSLSAKLAGDVSLKRNIKDIKAARDELMRIDESFSAQRISAAGRRLSLGDEWVAKALELGKFRNQKLGHGGTQADQEDLARWLEKPEGAPALARAILRAYLDQEKSD